MRLKTPALIGAMACALTLALAGDAAAAKYEKVDTDPIAVNSADGNARSRGSVYWYKGCNLIRCVRRGDYSKRSIVRALKPVGCIWAKVHYTYATGGFDVSPGGPAGSVSSGNYTQDGYYSSCHTGKGLRPKAIQLYGIGYPKFGLFSTTLEICTSKRKADGPRFCANRKMNYPILAD